MLGRGRFTDGGQRALVLLLVAVLAVGCSDDQRRLWCRTVHTIDGLVKPTVALALPLLAPQLADRYAVLVGAVDAAAAALRIACEEGKSWPQLDTAIGASIDLLAWWQANKDAVHAVTQGRRSVVPDDSAEVLEQLRALRLKRERERWQG